MIIGIGIDQIPIKRIENCLLTHGSRFKNRVYTQAEITYCTASSRYQAARFAKRFAAKEAALKALGTGYAQGVSWRDISITNDPSGQPMLQITGRTLEILKSKCTKGAFKASVSLSDTQSDALAFVVFEDCEKLRTDEGVF